MWTPKPHPRKANRPMLDASPPLSARLPLSALSADHLYARAKELRSMAATACQAFAAAALVSLAERFEALAAARVEMSSAVAGPASDAAHVLRNSSPDGFTEGA
jgi:hypothetical protein